MAKLTLTPNPTFQAKVGISVPGKGKVITTGKYLEATAKVLNRYGGLYFNDETFVIARNKE